MIKLKSEYTVGGPKGTCTGPAPHRLAGVLPVAVIESGDEASEAAGRCPHQPLIHPHLCLSKLLGLVAQLQVTCAARCIIWGTI